MKCCLVKHGVEQLVWCVCKVTGSPRWEGLEPRLFSFLLSILPISTGDDMIRRHVSDYTTGCIRVCLRPSISHSYIQTHTKNTHTHTHTHTFTRTDMHACTKQSHAQTYRHTHKYTHAPKSHTHTDTQRHMHTHKDSVMHARR